MPIEGQESGIYKYTHYTYMPSSYLTPSTGANEIKTYYNPSIA